MSAYLKSSEDKNPMTTPVAKEPTCEIVKKKKKILSFHYYYHSY